MKKFNVEILGREVSVYGGIDGHEVGTEIVGHKVIDIMDLQGDFTVMVHRSSKWINHDYISIEADNGDFPPVEPGTHNFGIKLPDTIDMYEIAKAIMGVDKIGDHFEEYCKITSHLEYFGISLKEFQALLKRF